MEGLQRTYSSRSVYLSLLAVGSALAVAVVVLLTATMRMSLRNEPLINAAHEIALETAHANYWLTTPVQQDSEPSIRRAREHIAEAQWYALAMLQGGSNENETLTPAADPEAIEIIRRIQEALTGLEHAIDNDSQALDRQVVTIRRLAGRLEKVATSDARYRRLCSLLRLTRKWLSTWLIVTKKGLSGKTLKRCHNVSMSFHGSPRMIIEVEDRFCKVAQVLSQMLTKVEHAAAQGAPVHEVEESAFSDLLEMGRQTVTAFIERQREDVPRPKTIEHAEKTLRRLRGQRKRAYMSAFGPTPFQRDVYATRETQRQEVVPLDAKLGMPEGDVSYLLQKWGGTKCAKESYKESRASLQEFLGFAPSVNCLEDMVSRAGEHTDAHFDEQPPVDPETEEELLVVTSDCKGVPMRKADAPQSKRDEETPAVKRKRLKKGEKNGQKRMACVGGVYSVARFRRTAEDVIDEILRKEKQKQRPKPQNKRLRAQLTREVDGQELNAKDVIFDWLAKEVQQRDPHEGRTVIAIMDGETKLRDLQELKISRAIGILDIWHVTEYLWKLAYCFHPEGSDEAEAFVETYLRKLLEGKVRRVIGGVRQMVTKADLPKHKRQKARRYLNYFAARCDYMKYDEYLAAGYPIGSGVVEGACRHLVKDRMEQTGMRWRIAGAQAVLNLRAIYLNDDWDTFHADRIQAEQRKLYPYKTRLHATLNCAT